MADNSISPAGALKFQNSDYTSRVLLRAVDIGSGAIRVEMVACDAQGNPSTIMQSWDSAGEIGYFGTATGAQPAAITSLTNSTGVTPDNTLSDYTPPVAAAGEATAADLTTTQAAFVVMEDSIADLGGKVNEILAALRTQGIIAT